MVWDSICLERPKRMPGDMRILQAILETARRPFGSRTEFTRWSDARAMPYTEGQAVVGPGQIGPGPAPIAHD
ncbi:MAG: hypothetical protein QNJ88_11625 [Acidimicrobiia bacterium]|nr:hypothetical protein [Acidimicrobiia bacterium]